MLALLVQVTKITLSIFHFGTEQLMWPKLNKSAPTLAVTVHSTNTTTGIFVGSNYLTDSVELS